MWFKICENLKIASLNPKCNYYLFLNKNYTNTDCCWMIIMHLVVRSFGFKVTFKPDLQLIPILNFCAIQTGEISSQCGPPLFAPPPGLGSDFDTGCPTCPEMCPDGEICCPLGCAGGSQCVPAPSSCKYNVEDCFVS